MTRIITLANQKGGVGKTTTAVNLGAGLARAGRRTLLIDMDPQANATFAILGRVAPAVNTYTVLIGQKPARDAITHTDQAGLDILPSVIDLAGAETELIGEIGAHTALRAALNASPLDYDYIVIDAPPSLGLLTINALAAADEVIIPVSAGVFALNGIVQLENTIERVRTRLDRPGLHVAGVLVTMYDHTIVAREVVEAIRGRFGELAFETVIPKNVRLEEAHSRQESIFTWSPDSTGAVAYGQLVEEVLDRG